MDFEKFNVWLFLFIFSGLLNVALIGGICNLMAVANNQGKMPVYEPTSNSAITGSEKHIYFNKSTDVNFYYLSDIFKLGNLYFSIGDLTLFISFLFTLGMDLILLKYFIDYKKQKWALQKKLFPNFPSGN